MGDFLMLNEAADRLGVHYMTAYRYVRLGLLPAHKEGGTWRVASADLDLFQHRHANGSSEAAPHKGAPWHQRLENRLLEGDLSGAWKVLEGAMMAGTDPLDVYCDVIVPALASIGHRWEMGEIGVAEEHQATALSGRLLGRMGPHFSRRGRRRGTVVVAGPPGERHSLGLTMVGDALRQGGYAVVDLGTDLPIADFGRAMAARAGIKAVCIGVLNPAALDDAAEMVAEARRHLERTAPVILGGGAVAGTDHARLLGADRAADLRQVVEAVDAGRDVTSSVWV